MVKERKTNLKDELSVPELTKRTEEDKICPVCNKKLQIKYEGYVCKNFVCPLYFKLEKGWVYLSNEKKNSKLFFTQKYYFDINKFENKKKWLQLKSKILYEREKCEICSSDIFLHVHHILPRSSNPELTMDVENLMVLCEECHKKIHGGDKYAFR